MENLILGLPNSTFFVITGVPVFIVVLLVIWVFWYKPADSNLAEKREAGKW